MDEHAAKRALAIAAGATFMAFLDVTVVNVAFPDLGESFAGTPIADLSWVVSAYAVVFAALLTPAGRLADVLGRRRLFVIGVAGFTVASAASAVAPSVAVLVAARAVQGAAAALMIPAALGLVLGFTPPERRVAAVGVWAASGSLAAAAGPALGGVLVDLFGWRSVFAVNLPIGLGLAIAARGALGELPSGSRRLPDPLGTALLVVGVGALATGLTKAGDWGWGDTATLACFGAGTVLLAASLARSGRHPAPAIETSLWESRVFAQANVVSVLFGAAMFAWMLICPLFAVRIWGYSVLEAGLAVSPGAITATVAAVAVSKLETAGARRAAAVGGALLLAADGLWMYLGLPDTSHFLTVWLPAGLISGVAMGAVMTAVSAATATSVEPERFAAATGLNMTARQLGGGLGVAAAAAILTTGALGPDDFRAVFLLCAGASLLAALPALRLVAAGPAPATAVAEPRRAT